MSVRAGWVRRQRAKCLAVESERSGAARRRARGSWKGKRMSRLLGTMLKLAVGGAVVLGMAGCQAPSAGHTKAVNAASQRWKDARSALVIKIAQQAFDRGDLDRAESTLLEAVAIDPENANLHLLAGRLALERGQLERSHGRLQRAIELDEQLSQARYFQGVVLQRWQRYSAALNRYREAYALQADNIAYLLAVGEMLVATDQADQAIELLTSKLVYFDQSAAIRVALGQLYGLDQDHDRAAELLREALLLDPTSTAIAEELAAAESAAGQTAAAIETLEYLCANVTVESRPDLWRLLAGSYRQAHRLGDARAIYEQLRDSAPLEADNWIKLGELAWLEENTATALRSAKRAIALAPHRHEGYLLAGMVWQKRGRADEALRMFDRAAELAPDNADPLILRGITLQRDGQPDEAAKAYAQALQRQPTDDRARSLLLGLTTAQVPDGR